MKVRQARSGATVTVSGAVHDEDGPELGAALISALGDGRDGDVLLDAHSVTEFDDGALRAFAAVRTRAKHLHRGFAVLDEEDGATARSLRRSGHVFRITVHPDAGAARAALSEGRSRTAARNPLPPAAEPAHRGPGVPAGARAGTAHATGPVGAVRLAAAGGAALVQGAGHRLAGAARHLRER
ncbi:phospholipase D-like domain-containing protein [Kineococcus sp. SYSU DK005]|uniref:hypothetical protein n=1 Tax=Kineococcus sp. SYSU DK005 TaxID=3383126 RepID=UPI003D7CCF11